MGIKALLKELFAEEPRDPAGRYIDDGDGHPIRVPEGSTFDEDNARQARRLGSSA